MFNKADIYVSLSIHEDETLNSLAKQQACEFLGILVEFQ